MCPPPTGYVPRKFPDPERVEPFAPGRPETFLARHFRGFGPRLTLLACEERLLIGQENPGGEQRAQSMKHRPESTDQMLFILTPDF